MRVTPGQPIPFWFRLWDGNPSRYVVAHVTNSLGVEQAGSPYLLSYSGNRGIYAATGPFMGFINLVVDYEVYIDSGYTQLDTSYLPAAEWVQPDVAPAPQMILLNRPIVGTIQPIQLSGSVLCQIEVVGTSQQNKIKGFVSSSLLTGTVSMPELRDML